MDRNRKIYLAAGSGLVLIISLLLVLSIHKKGSQNVSTLEGQQAALAASPYSDPVLQYLPYGGIGYEITPVIKTMGSKATLVLGVKVTFSDADYRSTSTQQNELINERKQSALDYLKSKGLNPSNYLIEYSLPSTDP